VLFPVVTPFASRFPVVTPFAAVARALGAVAPTSPALGAGGTAALVRVVVGWAHKHILLDPHSVTGGTYVPDSVLV
jgi:hypothetical protein